MVIAALTNRFATFETGSTKPQPVHTCTRCGNRMERKRKYCQPCSATAYDENVARNRTRSQQRYAKATGDKITDLGKACRAAGITLDDIKRIATAKARWEGEANG